MHHTLGHTKSCSYVVTAASIVEAIQSAAVSVVTAASIAEAMY